MADAISKLVHRAEVSEAGRVAALEQLEQLYRYVRRTGGFMDAADQSMLWAVRATLVEGGRKP